MTNKIIQFFENNFQHLNLHLSYSADLKGRILLTGATIDDDIATFNNWDDCYNFLKRYEI